MRNTKYDDKFYRLPKRLFKDDQFRSITNEAKALYMILLKADNSNWLSKQFVHRKGRTNEKEIL